MKFNFKIKSWNGLSLRIIALFATAMLVSYSPALLREFFEDKFITPDAHGYRWTHSFLGIDEEWDWGYRHYLYFIMCLALFFVQAARLIKWVSSEDRDFTP